MILQKFIPRSTTIHEITSILRDRGTTVSMVANELGQLFTLTHTSNIGQI